MKKEDEIFLFLNFHALLDDSLNFNQLRFILNSLNQNYSGKNPYKLYSGKIHALHSVFIVL